MSTKQAGSRLDPPFSRETSISSAIESSYPASFRHENLLLDPQHAHQLYLETDLKTPKLNALYPRLWLAGLTRPTRPLHRQKLIQRTIYLTESPDEHLVWHKDSVFIKPVPGYLLSYEFWEQHLCSNKELVASATGLLLSYVWLIASTIDYTIAISENILPSSVSWERWRNIVRDILHNLDTVTTQIDRRYHYGELRLSRLNTLYRIDYSTFSLRNLVYGFMSTPTWYTRFFERNFSWILAAFIYITVILSAMQVGLATSVLQNDVQFQNLSYGIAVTAIVIVAAAIVLMLGIWVVLFWFHLCSTIRYSTRETAKRRKMHRSGE